MDPELDQARNQRKQGASDATPRPGAAPELSGLGLPAAEVGFSTLSRAVAPTSPFSFSIFPSLPSFRPPTPSSSAHGRYIVQSHHATEENRKAEKDVKNQLIKKEKINQILRDQFDIVYCQLGNRHEELNHSHPQTGVGDVICRNTDDDDYDDVGGGDDGDDDNNNDNNHNNDDNNDNSNTNSKDCAGIKRKRRKSKL